MWFVIYEDFDGYVYFVFIDINFDVGVVEFEVVEVVVVKMFVGMDVIWMV